LKTKKFIENLGKGSTFKAITKDELENIFIPLPPLQEQQKIAEILSTIDEKLELERKRKEKLERIKIGLMNDLLIGKIRITQFYNKN
jgi:type I restriction enzyme S subunit